MCIRDRMMTFLVGVCDDKAMGKKYAEEGCIPLLVRCLQKHTEDAAFCEETMRVLGFVLLVDKAMAVFVDNGGLSVVIDLMKKYESMSEIIYRGYLLLWIVCHTQDYCNTTMEKGISDLLNHMQEKYMDNEKIVACCIGFCHQMVMYPAIASALAATPCLQFLYEAVRRYSGEEEILDHCVIILTKMLQVDLSESSVVEADILTIVVDALKKSPSDSSLREDICNFLVALLHSEEARTLLIQQNLTSFLMDILKSSSQWSLLSAVCCMLEVLCVDGPSLEIMETESVDKVCETKLHTCQDYPEFIGSCSLFLRAYLKNRAAVSYTHLTLPTNSRV